MTIEPLYDRGHPYARFKVMYQKQNGEIRNEEVEAHSFADAAWRVARETFDCFSPGTWQLLDVIRLR